MKADRENFERNFILIETRRTFKSRRFPYRNAFKFHSLYFSFLNLFKQTTVAFKRLYMLVGMILRTFYLI